MCQWLEQVYQLFQVGDLLSEVRNVHAPLAFPVREGKKLYPCEANRKELYVAGGWRGIRDLERSVRVGVRFSLLSIAIKIFAAP